MKELLDKNIDYLSKLTEEEANFIMHVLSWPPEQVNAFKLAKALFEEVI